MAMIKRAGLNVFFCVGKQAGITGMLAALAAGHRSVGAVCYDEESSATARLLGLHVYPGLNAWGGRADVLLSVHGREFVPRETLRRFSFGGVNLHPCYFEFPGPRPIGRWVESRDDLEPGFVSVVAHRMTERIDRGMILSQEGRWLDPKDGEAALYGQLYPLYARVAVRALRTVVNHD